MIENAISKSLTSNLLNVYDDQGNINVDRAADLVDASSRAELAHALGLTADQIRPDRLTGKAKERLLQLAATLDFVGETFKGNEEKTRFWLRTGNPHFGGASPRQLIMRGKYQTVFQFVLDARQGA